MINIIQIRRILSTCISKVVRNRRPVLHNECQENTGAIFVGAAPVNDRNSKGTRKKKELVRILKLSLMLIRGRLFEINDVVS